jgi:hypothetical protein
VKPDRSERAPIVYRVDMSDFDAVAISWMFLQQMSSSLRGFSACQ